MAEHQPPPACVTAHLERIGFKDTDGYGSYIAGIIDETSKSEQHQVLTDALETMLRSCNLPGSSSKLAADILADYYEPAPVEALRKTPTRPSPQWQQHRADEPMQLPPPPPLPTMEQQLESSAGGSKATNPWFRNGKGAITRTLKGSETANEQRRGNGRRSRQTSASSTTRPIISPGTHNGSSSHNNSDASSATESDVGNIVDYVLNLPPISAVGPSSHQRQQHHHQQQHTAPSQSQAAPAAMPSNAAPAFYPGPPHYGQAQVPQSDPAGPPHQTLPTTQQAGQTWSQRQQRQEKEGTRQEDVDVLHSLHSLQPMPPPKHKGQQRQQSPTHQQQQQQTQQHQEVHVGIDVTSRSSALPALPSLDDALSELTPSVLSAFPPQAPLPQQQQPMPSSGGAAGGMALHHVSPFQDMTSTHAGGYQHPEQQFHEYQPQPQPQPQPQGHAVYQQPLPDLGATEYHPTSTPAGLTTVAAAVTTTMMATTTGSPTTAAAMGSNETATGSAPAATSPHSLSSSAYPYNPIPVTNNIAYHTPYNLPDYQHGSPHATAPYSFLGGSGGSGMGEVGHTAEEDAALQNLAANASRMLDFLDEARTPDDSNSVVDGADLGAGHHLHVTLPLMMQQQQQQDSFQQHTQYQPQHDTQSQQAPMQQQQQQQQVSPSTLIAQLGGLSVGDTPQGAGIISADGVQGVQQQQQQQKHDAVGEGGDRDTTPTSHTVNVTPAPAFSDAQVSTPAPTMTTSGRASSNSNSNSTNTYCGDNGGSTATATVAGTTVAAEGPTTTLPIATSPSPSSAALSNRPPSSPTATLHASTPTPLVDTSPPEAVVDVMEALVDQEERTTRQMLQLNNTELTAVLKTMIGEGDISDGPGPCRFFLKGSCRRPDCFYTHDCSAIPCKYFQSGWCMKGDACAFHHDRVGAVLQQHLPRLRHLLRDGPSAFARELGRDEQPVAPTDSLKEFPSLSSGVGKKGAAEGSKPKESSGGSSKVGVDPIEALVQAGGNVKVITKGKGKGKKKAKAKAASKPSDAKKSSSAATKPTSTGTTNVWKRPPATKAAAPTTTAAPMASGGAGKPSAWGKGVRSGAGANDKDGAGPAVRAVPLPDISDATEADKKELFTDVSWDAAKHISWKDLVGTYPQVWEDRLFRTFKENGFDLDATVKELAKTFGAPKTRETKGKSTTERGPPKGPRKADTVRPPKQWVSTGQEVGQAYLDLRSEAIEYAQLRNNYLNRATQAYLSGNPADAKRLSRMGRDYAKKMRSAHRRAAEQLFASRNKVLPKENMLDLHGLHVKEATEYLSVFLEKLKRSRKHTVGYVITGTGHHSKHKHLHDPRSARLLPAVQRWLAEQGYTYRDASTDQRGGMLCISV